MGTDTIRFDQRLTEIKDSIQALTLEVRTASAAQREICRSAQAQRQDHADTLYGERGLKDRMKTVEMRQESL